jgi:signal transduction histidine kinase/ActR/RegA family two-component response regulator
MVLAADSNRWLADSPEWGSAKDEMHDWNDPTEPQDGAVSSSGKAPLEHGLTPDHPRREAHVCLVYSTNAEREEGLTRFFAEGLEAGQRCLLVGDDGLRRRLARRLRVRGFDVPLEPQRKAPFGNAPRDLVRAQARSASDDLLEILERLEERARAAGYGGLRVSWETRQLTDLNQLPLQAAFEEQLCQAVSRHPIDILCRVARKRIPPHLLGELLRPHGRVMLGDTLCPNPFYEPPEISRRNGSARLDWRLGALRQAQAAEARFDDTSRQLVEKEAELESARRVREGLLSKLAHELRNPLATLGNALEVLGVDGVAEAKRHRALAAAQRQLRHEARLIDTLLDAEQIVSGRMVLSLTSIDLGELVREVVENHRRPLASPQVELKLPSEPLRVRGDRSRLGLALFHLFRNALRLSSGPTPLVVRVAGTAEGWAVVRVRSRGPAIPDELLPRIFDIFLEQPQDPGPPIDPGIGLAIVKSLVEGHGGEVEARHLSGGNEIGFRLRLESGDGQLAPATGSGIPSGAAHRILVIEDSADTGSTLRDLLELAGYEVELASSGHAGIDAAEHFYPEVVLCDLGLPGMNGFEVAQALRRHEAAAHARLIAVTGYGQENDRQRSREAGFDLHLTKPVDPRELRRLLREAPEIPRSPEAPPAD